VNKKYVIHLIFFLATNSLYAIKNPSNRDFASSKLYNPKNTQFEIIKKTPDPIRSKLMFSER